MFLNTLNITDIVVQLTHKKHREARRMATTDQTNEDQTNAPNEDQTHEDGSTTDKEDFQKSMLEDNKYKRKPNTTMRAMIEEHIELFPCVDSHYCRQESQRQYLASDLSISKMYNLFQEWAPEHHPNSKIPGKTMYESVFTGSYNLGFYVPKKDQCDTCESFKNLPERSAEDKKFVHKEKERLKKDPYTVNTDRLSDHVKAQIVHIEGAERARHEFHTDKKNAETKLAENENSANENSGCDSNGLVIDLCSFDLQKILSTPCLNVSKMYYLSKYTVYNLVIKSVFSGHGDCYMWGEVDGKKGANEIGTGIYKYIEKKTAAGNIKEFIFYSDNCPGQNLNRILPICYMYCAKKFGVTITHKFLQVGHTQMGCDTVHSVIIERKKKSIKVYTPDQWQTVVELSGCEVDFLTYNDFMNFQDNIKLFANWHISEAGEKINWTLHKAVKVDPVQPFVLQMKLKLHSDQLIVLNLLEQPDGKSTRSKQSEKDTLLSNIAQLYNSPLKVAKKKVDKLLQCCRENTIPAKFHHFYENLRPDPDLDNAHPYKLRNCGARGSTRGSTHGARGSTRGSTRGTPGSNSGARGSTCGARGSTRGARGSTCGARGSTCGACGSTRGSNSGAAGSDRGARGNGKA